MDTEIKFRVATEDKARFERAAAEDGRKLSDWVRRACFAALPVETISEAAKRASEEFEAPSAHKRNASTLTRAEREAKIVAAQKLHGMGGVKKK